MKIKYHNNHKKTIAIISPFASPRTGGTETHIDSLIAQCKKREYDIILITKNKKSREYYSRIGDNITIYHIWSADERFLEKIYERYLKKNPFLKLLGRAIFKYNILKFIICSSYIIRKNRSKICLIHAQAYVTHSASRTLYRLFDIPYVITVHTYPSLFNEGEYKLSPKSVVDAKAVFVSSKMIFDKFSGHSPKNMIEYKQWIDLDKFYPMKTTEDVEEDKKIKLLIVGRFSEDKRFHDIVDKIAHIPNTKLLVIGHGHGFKKISEYRGEVKIMSSVENHSLNRYYNWADYHIIPNIVSGNIPRTCMESLASGTPLLRVLPENKKFMPWLEDMQEKYLVSNLRDMKKKNEQIIRKCRAYAEKNFSPKNSEIIFAEYDRIIKNNQKNKNK